MNHDRQHFAELEARRVKNERAFGDKFYPRIFGAVVAAVYLARVPIADIKPFGFAIAAAGLCWFAGFIYRDLRTHTLEREAMDKLYNKLSSTA